MNSEAGKGPKIRKGANLRAYWEADYWKILEEKKKKQIKEIEQSASQCDEPDKSKESS